ncbi:MAG: cupredoxin domain-containing protein [Candidatus Micrarchaeota archaeon]|nr:cupredoxin domain-containing protein [Candidatus Micrarchaeota archaeon]
MVSMKAIGGVVIIVIIVAAIGLFYGKSGSGSGSLYGSGSTSVATSTVPATTSLTNPTTTVPANSTNTNMSNETTPAAGSASFNVELSNPQGQFVITPKVIMVSPGENVTLNVTNDGTMTHNLMIPGLNVASPAAMSPGQNAVLKFTVPMSATGNYTYYCSVDSHRELGMVGTLVVKAG